MVTRSIVENFSPPGSPPEAQAQLASIGREQAQFRRLELCSILEATTLMLLVCIAVPLKHLAGFPIATRIMGPVHGLAFLIYIWTALQTVAGGDWTVRDKLRLFIVAFIPFAGYFNLAWLKRRNAALTALQS